VTLALPKYGVDPLESLSIKKSFLGIASALLGFGRLAMHDKSPESLCHATQASAWGITHLPFSALLQTAVYYFNTFSLSLA
jgi:hypothetical protein